MQLHILQRKSPFRLQICLFAFFAKLLKFSRKFEKWSCKWCKSAVNLDLHVLLILLGGKFLLNITSDDKNDRKNSNLSKFVNPG